MKKLIFILMLLPMFCIGQMSKKDSVWIEKGKQELQEMIVLAKGNTITFEESIKAEQCIVITDKIIKEYIDWCYKDSTYVKYVVDYSQNPTVKNDTLDLTVINTTISLYTVAGEWRHKEPTFVGFYEWLKIKK